MLRHLDAQVLRLHQCALAGFLRRTALKCDPTVPFSRPPSPVPRLSPQGTPEALAYPILRRLSSTSESGAAPCSAWLGAVRCGRRTRRG